MIDSTKETLISLADAAKNLPRRRGGRKPHVSCLYRWTTSGCKGVVLESLQVSGTRCTSKEALARFFEALTNATGTKSHQSPPARRERAAAAAEQELERAGL